MTVLQNLKNSADADYAAFQAKLVPTIPQKLILGVRVPALRTIAKQMLLDGSYKSFIKHLPHKYYDENMLHAIIISQLKSFDDSLRETQRFLPFVDNWAVCDILSPKAFAKNKGTLIAKIMEWSSSSHPYTCRFGMEMLMVHFLDDDFVPEYLDIPSSVKSGEYYVNMMIAWFFATALAKQWDAALPYIENGRLSVWVHNKAIQKSIESFRVTDEHKIILKALRRKN